MSYDLSAIKVHPIQSMDGHLWDAYVNSHPRATLYHLWGWKNVIERTYGHSTYYLMATEDKPELMVRNDRKAKGCELSATRHELNANSVVGILPLIHINHFIFGNSLISMPFLDYGGVLADSENAERTLVDQAIKLGKNLRVRNIELRHINPLPWIDEISWLNQESPNNPINPLNCVTKTHKVRMLLELPKSPEELIQSFKSKLRSQIKKSLREGLKEKVGGLELLNDFYRVFSINMRDLGSPVHSRKLMTNILLEFPGRSKIVVIYKDGCAFAASIIIGFKDTLENPWASALRRYRKFSPNMLLYWTMLEYACNSGFKYFDFGRSSLNEGTYKFKEQWGSKPITLHWHYISLGGKPIPREMPEKSKFTKGIKAWQKLPTPVTTIIGPRIRKYIGL
jgi:FemAB-related protein (PEP-CTERM system-associated)